jgi:hypothetical protein
MTNGGFHSQFIYTHSGISPSCIWKFFYMSVPQKETKHFRKSEKETQAGAGGSCL